MTSDGRVRLVRDKAVATVWFDRPEARNAMTPQMYRQFAEICTALSGDHELRVAVFRGVGGKAFVAGSDIAQFLAFETEEDGIIYEREMDARFAALASIPVPTIAVIEGYAVGGGLNIAAGCDLRIATPGSRLGVPIARTIGNCLSIASYARLLAGFGEGAAKRMLLLGELLTAEEAKALGFVTRIAAAAELEAAIEAMVAQVLANAPITLSVSKQALHRLQQGALPEADDLIRRCYGSTDFKAGVRAFVDKTTVTWRGE